jgi:hypothetical protein
VLGDSVVELGTLCLCAGCMRCHRVTGRVGFGLQRQDNKLSVRQVSIVFRWSAMAFGSSYSLREYFRLESLPMRCLLLHPGYAAVYAACRFDVHVVTGAEESYARACLLALDTHGAVVPFGGGSMDELDWSRLHCTRGGLKEVRHFASGLLAGGCVIRCHQADASLTYDAESALQ